MPLPADADAVAPFESVTVSVTDNGCDAPSVVLCGPPQVHVNENALLPPLWLNVLTSPSVNCTAQSNFTSPFVPSGNDVDSRTHVLPVLLVIRHSVAGLAPLTAGSRMRNETEIVAPPPAD